MVLCAVGYTVAEDEWIFPLCYGFFSVCHGLHRAVVSILPLSNKQTVTVILCTDCL